jgi:small subunit ribosomal protein S20
LANILSAKKRARQSIKRREHNVALRSRMRTAMKSVVKAIEARDKAAAQASFKEAVPAIDKAVSKGLIAKNRAAHYKSRLNARLKALT